VAMPSCDLRQHSRHGMLSRRHVRLSEEIVRLVKGKLGRNVGSKGFESVRDVDGLASPLCLLETIAEKRYNLFDFWLGLLDLCHAEVGVHRTAPDTVDVVINSTKSCVRAAKCLVIPTPFVYAGTDLESFRPVRVIDMDLSWTDPNDWPL
jgi:hypothetical protein